MYIFSNYPVFYKTFSLSEHASPDFALKSGEKIADSRVAIDGCFEKTTVLGTKEIDGQKRGSQCSRHEPQWDLDIWIGSWRTWVIGGGFARQVARYVKKRKGYFC